MSSRQSCPNQDQATPIYANRFHAGEQLTKLILAEIIKRRLEGVKALPIIYGLPRGGIPVAVPIARQLACPLDVIIAKKITLPANRELAIGGVTSDGQVLWYPHLKKRQKDDQILDQALQQAQQKAQAQLELFEPLRPKVNPEGKIAIIIDDGIATGMTMEAAVKSLRQYQPQEIWLGATVAPLEIVKSLQQWSDHLFVLATPSPFFSVSRFYLQFPQVSNEEAMTYLHEHNQQLPRW
jgi:predicted phosphoribosyltransferase